PGAGRWRGDGLILGQRRLFLFPREEPFHADELGSEFERLQQAVWHAVGVRVERHSLRFPGRDEWVHVGWSILLFRVVTVASGPRMAPLRDCITKDFVGSG